MSRIVYGFFLAATFFVSAQSVFAAPIVAGSFSTTWDTSDGVLSNLALGACADSVYWEEIGNEANNGTDNSCDGFSRTTVTVSGPGQFRVDYSGTFTRILFPDVPTRGEFRTVEQWGDSEWEILSTAFSGISNLSINAVDIPIFAAGANLTQMFRGATAFNSDISNWDVSNVADMDGMFFDATLFNQDISSWNVGNVTDMQDMFQNATAFNQDLSGWNVSSVTRMQNMFAGATAFNADISNWDVSSVTNFAPSGEGGCVADEGMFYGATSFNQNLANWNIANAQCIDNMFTDAGLSTENYTAILIGWSDLAVQTDLDLGQVGSISSLTTYCASAQVARDILTSDNSWAITDGGSVPCNEVEVETAITSESTKIGERLRRLEDKTSSSTPIEVDKESFLTSVRDLIDYLLKHEEVVEDLTPEESTRLIIAMRDIVKYLISWIPGVS